MIKAWFWGLSPALILSYGIIGAVMVIVIVALKGYSLWYAAKNRQLAWFIILLIINTLGILEIIYLVFVLKKVRFSEGHFTKSKK